MNQQNDNCSVTIHPFFPLRPSIFLLLSSRLERITSLCFLHFFSLLVFSQLTYICFPMTETLTVSVTSKYQFNHFSICILFWPICIQNIWNVLLFWNSIIAWLYTSEKFLLSSVCLACCFSRNLLMNSFCALHLFWGSSHLCPSAFAFRWRINLHLQLRSPSCPPVLYIKLPSRPIIRCSWFFFFSLSIPNLLCLNFYILLKITLFSMWFSQVRIWKPSSVPTILLILVIHFPGISLIFLLFSGPLPRLSKATAPSLWLYLLHMFPCVVISSLPLCCQSFFLKWQSD